jgi:dTDP-4-amino-4,6-dideoxygalactose transaminase
MKKSHKINFMNKIKSTSKKALPMVETGLKSVGSTANAVAYCGATPHFVDSSFETLGLDVRKLRDYLKSETKLQNGLCINKITGKVIRAIVPMHTFGHPVDIDGVLELATEFNLQIVEDAAESLGSFYGNKHTGNFGRFGVISFNGNKIITTSGGGALLSNDENLIAKTRHVSAQAKDPAPYYLHTQIGYNYRLSNICAGIGRGQMEVLPERINKRRAIFEQYRIGLSGVEGICFLEEPNGFFSNRWLTTIVFDENYFKLGTIETLRQYLETLNIETRPLWKPLHQQPVFADCKSYNNGISDRLFDTGLCLPSGSNLSESVIENVINEIKKHLGV